MLVYQGVNHISPMFPHDEAPHLPGTSALAGHRWATAAALGPDDYCRLLQMMCKQRQNPRFGLWKTNVSIGKCLIHPQMEHIFHSKLYVFWRVILGVFVWIV